MSLSAGTYHVDVDGQFAEVIGALALANVRQSWSRSTDADEERYPGAEKHADLVGWIKQAHESREPWVMQLMIGAVAKSNRPSSPSATKVLEHGVIGIQMEDRGWFDREMAFWSSREANALVYCLSDEASQALDRKLPTRLSPDEALRWAQGLAASLR